MNNQQSAMMSTTDDTLAQPFTFHGRTGLLAEHLCEDCMRLQMLFHSHGQWLSPLTLEAVGLHLTPQALVNCGALIPASLGRWDSGYAPGRLLTDS